nr:MAG TPA: hypothetical protein [Caudoviricetes sp.]
MCCINTTKKSSKQAILKDFGLSAGFLFWWR